MEYEKQIHTLFPELYPSSKMESVHNLVQAWRLRRNCPCRMQSIGAMGQVDDYQAFYPDLEVLKKMDEMSLPAQLFESYHADHRPARDEVLNLRLESPTLPAELDLYEAIQDYLISRYEKEGLVIEACPVSNATIGRFAIEKHPLFRWFPPREQTLELGAKFNRFGLRTGMIRCCVNTDDPGVFTTTLQNEFELVKNAAKEHHGCSELQAQQWIEALRSSGVDLFLSNEKPC
ncbi:MAG: hypothetical protein V5783_08315 [Pontiella sp.]